MMWRCEEVESVDSLANVFEFGVYLRNRVRSFSDQTPHAMRHQNDWDIWRGSNEG